MPAGEEDDERTIFVFARTWSLQEVRKGVGEMTSEQDADKPLWREMLETSLKLQQEALNRSESKNCEISLAEAHVAAHHARTAQAIREAFVAGGRQVLSAVESGREAAERRDRESAKDKSDLTKLRALMMDAKLLLNPPGNGLGFSMIQQAAVAGLLEKLEKAEARVRELETYEDYLQGEVEL
jgi:hypothetical protein